MAIPSDISGLVSWFKADAITGLSDGAQVATWTDSSTTAGNATQATSADRPIYKTGIVNGLPVVRFQDTSDSLTVASPGTYSATTIFAVVRFPNTTADSPIFRHTSNGGIEWRCQSPGVLNLDRRGIANVFTGTTTLSTSSFTIVTLSSSNAANTHAQYINGTVESTASGGNDPDSSGAYEFGRMNAAGNFDYAELIVYNSALSDTDRNAITSYLGSKYAITVAGGAPATTAGASTANATGAVPSSTAQVIVRPAAANATGAAPSSTAQVIVRPTTANATGAVPSSTAQVVVRPAAANATGAAPAPATSSAQVVTPTAANATGATPTGAAFVRSGASPAQASGAAVDAVVTSSATATAISANATGAANSSSALTAVVAPPATASATGVASASSSRVGVAPAVASSTGAAANALASSNSNVVVAAAVAAANGTAVLAATSATNAVATAAVTGQAAIATASGSTSATVVATTAQATGQASAAATSATNAVATAAATGQAPIATASGSTSAVVAATTAQGSGQASAAASSARTNIGAAAAAGQAPAVAVLGSSSTVVTPASAQSSGQAPTPTTSTGVVAVAQRASSFAVANGAAVSVQETEPGPTIIGLAEVADAVGFASGGSPRILVRAGTASGQAAVGGSQVSGLGRRRRLQAGIPSVRHSANPGVPLRRPAATRPWA